MEQKNKIQKTESVSPNQMIRLAIEGNADLEKLEKLLGLQERYESNEARKVFASAFSIVQENIAAVAKTKNNPQTHSKYAGLDSVIETSKPVYTKEGFSIIFYEGETKVSENIRVCADVLHKAGHKETYHFDVPLDGVGIKGNANMTKIHGKASSVSYGRRYLLCMIWNIPTQDDDGNDAGADKEKLPKEPTKAEQAVIESICLLLEKETGKIVSRKRVSGIFLMEGAKYPSDPKTVKAVTKWLINLKRESEWAEAKPAKEKPSNAVNKIIEQVWFEFNTVNADWLADHDGKLVFDKDKLIKAIQKKFNCIPTDKTPKEISAAIKPENIAIEMAGE